MWVSNREGQVPRMDAKAVSSTPPGEPPAWVRRFLPLVKPGGRVLDLAAGGGRHCRLLREAGFKVTAVDRQIAPLIEACGQDKDVSIVEMDLETGSPWKLGGDWDGIVVTNYLHRPLLPAIGAALAWEGVVIYETFALGNERFGKPSNPDFLLGPGELATAFGPPLSIVAFEQGFVQKPRPAAIQRIAARKGPPGALPIEEPSKEG